MRRPGERPVSWQEAIRSVVMQPLPERRVRLRVVWSVSCVFIFGFVGGRGWTADTAEAALPSGVKAVWDLDKAHRQKTLTRERVCLNGLWRWQPATDKAEGVPADSWGY